MDSSKSRLMAARAGKSVERMFVSPHPNVLFHPPCFQAAVLVIHPTHQHYGIWPWPTPFWGTISASEITYHSASKSNQHSTIISKSIHLSTQATGTMKQHLDPSPDSINCFCVSFSSLPQKDSLVSLMKSTMREGTIMNSNTKSKFTIQKTNTL